MSDLSGFRLRLLKALGPDAARELGEGMKNALRFHSRWLGEFHKSIVCGTPFPDDVRLQDGHCRCNFGRWVAVLDTTPLAGDTEIEKLRKLHAALHAKALELVERIEEDGLVVPVEYEGFLETHESFISKMDELIYEVIRTDLKFDPLTGTLGRPVMEEIVRREHLRSARTGTPACLAMVDIDRLKESNDTFGHGFGDKVLSVAANLFTEGLRPYDLLFRYGGDEFLICLPNADMVTARQIMERLRGSLESRVIPTRDGHMATATASFGVAELGGASMEECIERADQALYQAKQAGRNLVVAYGDDLRGA